MDLHLKAVSNHQSLLQPCVFIFLTDWLFIYTYIDIWGAFSIWKLWALWVFVFVASFDYFEFLKFMILKIKGTAKIQKLYVGKEEKKLHLTFFNLNCLIVFKSR